MQKLFFSNKNVQFSDTQGSRLHACGQKFLNTPAIWRAKYLYGIISQHVTGQKSNGQYTLLWKYLVRNLSNDTKCSRSKQPICIEAFRTYSFYQDVEWLQNLRKFTWFLQRYSRIRLYKKLYILYFQCSNFLCKVRQWNSNLKHV